MNFWLFLFLIFIGIILLTLAWSSISLAPFVPTRKKDLERIFKLADFKKGDIFYELGSGNGRVILAAAKKFNIQATGFEIAWPLWLFSEIKRLFFVNKKRVKFSLRDLFKVDLSKADVIYVFGMPDTIKNKLQHKLQNELKNGAKVISYAFTFSDWRVTEKSKPKKKDTSIYLYTIRKD